MSGVGAPKSLALRESHVTRIIKKMEGTFLLGQRGQLGDIDRIQAVGLSHRLSQPTQRLAHQCRLLLST